MSGPNNVAMFEDGQLAKAIYLRQMSAMKEVLNLGEIKFGSRQTEQYKYFKKVVMDAFYNSMSDVFTALEREGLAARCECGTSIRQGYKPCPHCSGSGYRNTDEFSEWLLSFEDETCQGNDATS